MDWKNCIRQEDIEQLQKNWRDNESAKGTKREQDHIPPVKLFSPAGAFTWLLSECDENGLCFGLADLGFGTPEMGLISLDEIFSVKIGGLYVEQDRYFRGTKTLSEYADEARQFGRIKA